MGFREEQGGGGDTALRSHLVDLLRGGHAHVSFEDGVADFPLEKAGTRPAGAPHSAWELLEHMRIAQHDILRFCQSADYQSPKWPQGYWPSGAAPTEAKAWEHAVDSFQKDLDTFEAMLRDPAQDLYKPFPWGQGQTLLREALVLADHNSYHLGQLVLVRRLLDAWQPG